MKTENAKKIRLFIFDILSAITAGVIVGTAYFFFQNSNGFAPGGVGGLATITHYLLGGRISWSFLMIAFNLPIFLIITAVLDRKLGMILSLYMIVQALVPKLLENAGVRPYCQAYSAEDFNVVFACIATGVVSGFGFSIMLRRFGASGGTYGISALIKKARPETNVAYISFIMDACVVFIAFFVYGMKVTPVICTLLNLFIANIIVDNGLNGMRNGYKFEIVTNDPENLAKELMTSLKHGVTQISVHGMYSDTDKYMLVCIVNKRQIGSMMKIIKRYPDTFASFQKVNEVFGRWRIHK